MPVNNKVNQQVPNAESGDGNYQWVMTAVIVLILTFWLIFFFVGFWKIPSFLLRSLYLLVVPMATLVVMMRKGISKKPGQREEGKLIPVFMTATLWIWIVFSLLAWEMPKHVGSAIAIKYLLWFSLVLIPGLGAGLLVQSSIQGIQDRSFSSWLILGGFSFLFGSLLFSLCFPTVFWVMGMFATG
ncbi:MAG: hypothetical protein GY805_38870 [Chloroflexi bacterium]|nr:hypothetical protein [Chloroflexota bacterium]